MPDNINNNLIEQIRKQFENVRVGVRDKGIGLGSLLN